MGTPLPKSTPFAAAQASTKAWWAASSVDFQAVSSDLLLLTCAEAYIDIEREREKKKKIYIYIHYIYVIIYVRVCLCVAVDLNSIKFLYLQTAIHRE